MPDLFLKGLSQSFPLDIYPLHEYWLDVGRPEDYERANKQFRLKEGLGTTNNDRKMVWHKYRKLT